MTKNPLFILGCHKSGTSLLRNLFDGHPSLFVIPFEAHFFQNTAAWVNYSFRTTRPETLTYEEMKERLIRWILFMNSKSNTIADSFTKDKWNTDAFKDYLSEKKITSLGELSDAYVEAMYYSLNGKQYNSELRFVEKSVENAEFALDWQRLYPEAKFIHIVRNPYANIVAIRKYLVARKFPVLAKTFLAMYSSYYFLYRNLRLIDKSNYKVILYEELVANPEKTMRELAEFSEISYSDLLLQPSLFGKEWTGNSTSKTKFTTISSANIGKWKDEISNYEIILINEFFKHLLEDFDYEIIEPKSSVLKKAKQEGFSAYFMNRALYYYLPRFTKPTKNLDKWLN